MLKKISLRKNSHEKCRCIYACFCYLFSLFFVLPASHLHAIFKLTFEYSCLSSNLDRFYDAINWHPKYDWQRHWKMCQFLHFVFFLHDWLTWIRFENWLYGFYCSHVQCLSYKRITLIFHAQQRVTADTVWHLLTMEQALKLFIVQRTRYYINCIRFYLLHSYSPVACKGCFRIDNGIFFACALQQQQRI